MSWKTYTLLELFDFKEGTRFITNFEEDTFGPKFEVWIEKGCLCVDDDENSKAFITKAWLESTFILK